MQKNTSMIIIIVALAVGLGIGYSVGKSNASQKEGAPNSGMHTMPDGSVMSNDGQSMSMANMMASMNDELRGKMGDEFDQAFISEMIVHHQGAVEMAQLALTNAKHHEIKDLAHAIISAQNKEIGDMKTWQQAWYNK